MKEAIKIIRGPAGKPKDLKSKIPIAQERAPIIKEP